MGVRFFFYVRVSLLYLISMRNNVVEQEHKKGKKKSKSQRYSISAPVEVTFCAYGTRKVAFVP